MGRAEELSNDKAIYAEDVKERRREYDDFDDDEDDYTSRF